MPNDMNLDRSREERMASLEKAKAARRARTEAKARLKSGEISVEEFLDMAAGDEVIGRMPVNQFLRAIPGVGTAKAALLMAEIGIADSRRLGGLGARQRKEIIARFAK